MIRTIEVKDKKYPVHYGMNALAEYSEMRGVSMNDALSLNTDKMNLMDFMTLVYVGIKDGARFKEEECAFKSLDKLLDFADENPEIIEKTVGVFSEYGKERKESKKK